MTSNYSKLIEKLKLNRSLSSKANSILLARSIHWYLMTPGIGIGYSKFLYSMAPFTKLPMDSSACIDFKLLPINRIQQYRAELDLDTALYHLAVVIGMAKQLSLNDLTNQAHWILQTLRFMAKSNQSGLALELNRIIHEYRIGRNKDKPIEIALAISE